MPVTVTYDFTQVPANQGNDRTYLRSMFERLHWRRVGGSVFRYEGVLQDDGTRYEDWLNHIAPALMFMRSYVVRRGLQMSFFTIDAASVSFLDHTDPQALLGTAAQAQVQQAPPTNQQCPPGAIEDFLTAATNCLPEPPPQP